MSRALSATMQTIIERGAGELLVAFLEFAFGNGTVRITTAPVDISWNGFTWEAVGGHLRVAPVVETPGDDRSQGVQLELGGVDQSLMSILLQRQYQGRHVRAWLGHINMGANSILRSRSLSLSPWATSQASISADADRGDDDRPVDKVVEAATTNIHRVSQAWTIPAGKVCYIACKLRQLERTRARLVLRNGSGNDAGARINLATNAVTAVTAGAGSVIDGGAERLAGGGALLWSYVQVDGSSTAVTLALELEDAAGNVSYAGDGSSGLLAWDLHALPVQAHLPYVETADVARADGAVADSPYECFSGYMNGGVEIEQTIEEDVASCEIRLRAVSRTAELTNRRGIKTNLASHQAFFPGDRFFEFVPALANRTLTWGTQRVKVGPSTGYNLPSTPASGAPPGGLPRRP